MIQRFILLFLFIGMIAGLYLYWRIGKLIRFYAKNVGTKFRRRLTIFLAALVMVLSANLFSTLGVVIWHFIVTFAVLDLLALIVRLIRRQFKNRREGKAYLCWVRVYESGVIPAVCALVLVLYGAYNMNHICQTEYVFASSKLKQEYSVMLITDIHYDSVQSPGVVWEALDKIAEEQPDIVILGGDLVEEGTAKERMQEIFGLLGKLPSRYGIYYVYGNHDRQPYTNRRTYTDAELEAAITESGIRILQDEYVEIADDVLLAGREGAAWGNVSDRLESAEVLQGADTGRYVIMADHQPVEAKENAAAGVDLEVAGHTHGGQIWPTGVLTELFGGYNYGLYRQGDCNVVVSSGMAGWAYSIRTGKHCEYVVIRLCPETNSDF